MRGDKTLSSGLDRITALMNLATVGAAFLFLILTSHQWLLMAMLAHKDPQIFNKLLLFLLVLVLMQKKLKKITQKRSGKKEEPNSETN